jgi:DNA-binding transcriptional regulator YdaS (Cro superfamily)
MKPIERAIEAIGTGQKGLADALNVTPQQVNQWVQGDRPVPAKHCLAIESACAGAVSRHELRSDVFGPAPPSKRARAA